jgi:transcriptional regulator with XRE-family HTH domain
MPATKKPPRQIAPGAAFAKLIVDARHAHGWSQDVLATRAGLNRTTILRWEAGVAARPDPYALNAACRILGISPLDALHALGYLDAAMFDSVTAATTGAAA